MNALVARRTARLRVSKRCLYFLVLWLPTLVPLIGIGVVIHVPFALVHALNARRKCTQQLLTNSWLVPPKVASWAAVEAACFLIWAEHSDRIGARHAARVFAAAQDTLLSFAFYVGLSFGAAVVYVCLGWLALLTFARHWPLEGS